MTLKRDPALTPAPDPSRPTWGELNSSGDFTPALRLRTEDTEVSFPYHVLRRWELIRGDTDQLVILAGDETVTITGTELTPIRDALDRGHLAIVWIHPGRAPAPQQTAVTAIAFAVEKR